MILRASWIDKGPGHEHSQAHILTHIHICKLKTQNEPLRVQINHFPIERNTRNTNQIRLGLLICY